MSKAPRQAATALQYTAYLDDSLILSQYGQWWHNGRPFENRKLADLFSRCVVWDAAQKRYFVQIGAQRATFTVEDTPYFVTAIDTDRSPWQIHLSDGSSEDFIPKHISIGKNDQFYFCVKQGHRARALRSVHQQLLQHAISDCELEISGKRVRLVREE